MSPADRPPAAPNSYIVNHKSAQDAAYVTAAVQNARRVPDGNLAGADADMSDADLSDLSTIAGFMGACLVDSDSNVMLAAHPGPGDFDLEAAGTARAEVVKAQTSAIRALGVDDAIEDILITQDTQYHLMRPLAQAGSVFMYVALDRRSADLGHARLALTTVQGALRV
jgi:predicted regulator of Ras-like GTPase activity (Roadblock/LC7/MglB family)